MVLSDTVLEPLAKGARLERTRLDATNVDFTTLLRDLGSCMSPFNAFLTLQGVETLPLRIERHSANTSAVAAWLAKQPAVTSVIHPSLQKGEAKRRAAS